MAQSMILDLLKTPQQVREQQLNQLRERSLAQANLIGPVSGGTTALPGLLSQFAQNAAANVGVDMNQAVRRGLGAAGQVAGAAGRPQVAQALQQSAMSPAERQAATVQQAMQGVNPSTVEGLETAIRRLQQAGAPQNVITLLSDRLAQLKVRDIKAPQTRELKIGDEIVTQQFNQSTGQWEEVARAPRTQPKTEVNVNTGGESAFTKQVAEQLGTAYTESLTAVDSAETSLQTLKVMEDIVDQGIIAGPFANSRVAVEKILAQAGIIDGSRVANTEAFLAASANQTLALLSSGVVGAGTGISDADREFLAKVSAANIDLTEESIRRIIRINRTVAQNVYNSHNQLVGRTRQVFPDQSNMVQERYYPGQRAKFPDGTVRVFDPVQGWVEE